MTSTSSWTHAFVIKLHPSDPLHPGGLSGRLEHVLSGRRHDFDNGRALLACLRHEQQQVALAAAADQDEKQTLR